MPAISDDDDAGDPAAHPGERGRRDRGRGAGPHVAQPRTAGDHRDEDALHPAAHLVRRVGLQDRLPVHRADQVGRAGEGEQHDGQPQLMRQTGQRDRGAPADDREGQRRALPADPADPAAGQPGHAPRRSRSRRTAGRPGRGSARRPPAGNSARGMASTIAAMSTPNDMTSTGRVAMNAQARRRPSAGPASGQRAVRRDRRQPQRRVQRRREQHRVDAVGVGEAVVERRPARRRSAGRPPGRRCRP